MSLKRKAAVLYEKREQEKNEKQIMSTAGVRKFGVVDKIIHKMLLDDKIVSQYAFFDL